MTTTKVDPSAPKPQEAQDNRLPLHPRKAQELFHEIISAHPDVPQNQKGSIAQRIQELQAFYRIGVMELKRGRWFRLHDPDRPSDEEDLIHVRLTATGESLSLQSYKDTAEEDKPLQPNDQVQIILLEHIERLTVFPNLICVLHLRTSENTRLLGLEADSEEYFHQWILNLALCHKTMVPNHEKNDALLDHALQLRTVELSQSIGIRKALMIMEHTFTQIYEREREQTHLLSPMFVFQWLTYSPQTLEDET